MHFTKTFFGGLAALLLSTACTDLGSSDQALSDQDGGVTDGDCTLTQGYWKNHEEAWPVASLTLGTRVYTKAELLVILKTPVKGNGLIKLAHQLIAAKLNIAAGASATVVASVIVDADALIGALVVGEDSLANKLVSELNDKLDAFNQGNTGPGHCDDGPTPPGCDAGPDCGGEEEPPPPPPTCDAGCPAEPVCGNGVMEGAETCDDGNLVNGDGCTSTCECEHEEEPAPVCGNHIVEIGEACDDGNLLIGDGCSATCTIEAPVCGDGVMEAAEQCDDGNTVDGDGCNSLCVCEP